MDKSNAFPQEGLVEAEDEPNGSYETNGSCDMIPSELHVKGHHAKKDEYAERNDFLNHLELHKRKWPSVACKADAVGRYHEGVLQKRNAPGKENDGVKRPVGDQLGALELEMGVPGERHEDVRDEKKTDGGKAFRKHDGGRAQTERL